MCEGDWDHETERRKDFTHPLEQVMASVENLRTEAELLRGEITVVDEKRKTATLRFYITMTILVVLFVGIFYIQTQNRANLQALRDCTVPSAGPGGECYQNSQKASALIVASLVESQREMNRCVVTSETDAEYDVCVTAALKKLEVKAKAAQEKAKRKLEQSSPS